MSSSMREQLLHIVALVLLFHTHYYIASQAPEANEGYEDILGLYDGNSSDPWYKQKLGPQPYPGFYVYTKMCVDNVGDRSCIRQVCNEFIGIGKVDNDECGCKVKKVGRFCVMTTAGTVGNMDKFKSDISSIIDRARKLYDRSEKLTCPELKKTSDYPLPFAGTN